MASQWYAAKTLYRTVADGGDDSAPVASKALIEERIVLLRASSQEHAIELGESEAKEYVAGPGARNRHGHRLVTEYLGTIDVFELFEKPDDGAEIYSGTYLVDRGIPGATLVDQQFGPEDEEGCREDFVPYDVES